MPNAVAPTRSLTFHPRILVRETYSDNINLAPADQAKSDAVTEVIPGFDLQAAGSRIRGDLSYSLQGVAYARHSNSDHIYNQVSGNATGVIVPEHFFVQANTAYSRAIINPAAPASTNNIFISGNTTNAWISHVNPYWVQRLGSAGTAKLSYAFGNIHYGSGSDDLSNSHSNTYQVSLSSPADNYRWFWSGNLHDYRDWIADGRQIIQRDAQAELGYRVIGNLKLLADGGWERNEQRQAVKNVFQGSYWAVGVKWSSPFDMLQFKVGHRFFGNTYQALWQHRAARFTTRLSYNETVSVVNQELQAQALQSLSPQTLPTVPLSALNAFNIFVSKRFAGSIRYNGAKTSIQLMAYDERRDYLSPAGRDHVTGATLGGNWQIGPRTSVFPSLEWESDRFREGQSYIQTSAQVGLRYMLGEKAHAALVYRYERRNANNEPDSYTMNMVYAQFVASF